jgi:hypothetical protein
MMHSAFHGQSEPVKKTRGKSQEPSVQEGEAQRLKTAEAEFKTFYYTLGKQRRSRLEHLIQREFAYRKLPVPQDALQRVAQAYSVMISIARGPVQGMPLCKKSVLRKRLVLQPRKS